MAFSKLILVILILISSGISVLGSYCCMYYAAMSIIIGYYAEPVAIITTPQELITTSITGPGNFSSPKGISMHYY